MDRGSSFQVEVAAQLMRAFADRTGLSSPAPPRRYLWTDAFAVCNLLGLARETGRSEHLDLALRLVDQVHGILGRRPADAGDGAWLSGLPDAEAAAHPTAGGLRIGKPLPERDEDEPFDERLEWERDGQYFHYLTRWMHALDQVARAAGEPRFNVWARELAAVARGAFCYGPTHRRRMVWKVSCDLRRPLVPSMGRHDPLDGLVTYAQLRSTAHDLGCAERGPDLGEATADFAGMVAGRSLASADPLDLGAALSDAYRMVQLAARGRFPDLELLDRLLSDALDGLWQYELEGGRRTTAEQRIAFRELGLAIGFRAAAAAYDVVKAARPPLRGPVTVTRLGALARYRPEAAAIAAYWLDPTHRRAPTWTEHRDIDEVMLATALAPEGFLEIAPLG